jgi:type I restriction enzyme M protein
MVKISNLGFTINYSDLSNLSSTHDLVEIKELVETDAITIENGDEIGKMAYGTGRIPFIRTSDISNWEIKADPKQGVSEKIYDEYAIRQDVQEGDIFLSRMVLT